MRKSRPLCSPLASPNMGALTLKTARVRTGGVVWNDLKAHPVPVAEEIEIMSGLDLVNYVKRHCM